MDPELRAALDDLGRRVDAGRDEAKAARDEAKAARDEAKAARDEAKAARDEAKAARSVGEQAIAKIVELGNVLLRLTDEVVRSGRVIAELAGAQAETAHQLGEVSARVGRLVQAQVETRTNEIERFAGLEARLEKLEREVERLRAGG